MTDVFDDSSDQFVDRISPGLYIYKDKSCLWAHVPTTFVYEVKFGLFCLQ